MRRVSVALILSISSGGLCANDTTPPEAVKPDIALSEVVVTAEATAPGPAGEYAATEINSLSLPLTPQQTPATVNVLTDQFWQATGARTLDSALTYIPGINMTDNGGWTGDAITIRGFSATLPYHDGMRSISSYGQSHRLMSENVERIEVVKGPAGNEFGVVEPGGAINIITKKPQRDTASYLDLTAGENGYYNVTGDTTGALVASDNVQGRFVFAYEEPPEWRDGRPDDTHRYLFAPSINWDYSENGNLLLQYEHNYQDAPQDRGIIYLLGAWKGGFAPREWSFHQDTSEQINETDRVTLTNQHRFNERLSWKTTLEYQELHYELNEFRNAESEPGWGPLYNSDGISWTGATVIPIYWDNWEGDGEASSYQSGFDYTLPAGSVTHTLSAGVRGYDNRTDNRYVYYTIANTFDIFHPVNNQAPIISSVDGVYTDKITTKENSVYGRWLAEWTDSFRTVVGVQSTDYDYTYDGYYNGVPDYDDSYGSNKESWRIASSYDLTPQHTAFVGISDGYVPQSGSQRSGSAVSPIHDKAVEAGIKSLLHGEQLQWTNSIYRTKREDMTVEDPTNTGAESFLVNSGSAQIEGFESELVGRINDDLELRGGIAFMRSELLENPVPFFNGNEFANTPTRQVSALVTYRWSTAGLPQLTTSLGATHIGDRYGNSGNSITLPGYTLIDASASWQIAPSTRITLAGTNLTDETYYTGMQDGNGNGADQVMIGDVRNVSLSVRHNF